MLQNCSLFLFRNPVMPPADTPPPHHSSGHPLDAMPPDYRNPLSDGAPLAADMCARHRIRTVTVSAQYRHSPTKTGSVNIG